MQKFMVMTIVKLEGKPRVVKVASTKVFPSTKKKPAANRPMEK